MIDWRLRGVAARASRRVVGLGRVYPDVLLRVGIGLAGRNLRSDLFSE